MLYRFQDVAGDLDIGMMLRSAAGGGWSLRFRDGTRCDRNREDATAHVALACNWSAVITQEEFAL